MHCIHGYKGAWTTLCPSEGLDGSELCPVCLQAVGAVLCGAAMESTRRPPALRGAVCCAVLSCVCAARGEVPALIQSGDAIGFTSALGIWDSAGKGSVMHLPWQPAQPVWPWESVPVANTTTTEGLFRLWLLM